MTTTRQPASAAASGAATAEEALTALVVALLPLEDTSGLYLSCYVCREWWGRGTEERHLAECALAQARRVLVAPQL